MMAVKRRTLLILALNVISESRPAVMGPARPGLDRVTRVCSHMNGDFLLILDNGPSTKMSRSYKDKVRHFF